MPATEHQKKEWLEAIKRDFPRLVCQEEVLKMMIDVYAENPGYLQGLARKMEKEKHKAPVPGPDPRFASGEIHGAVEIISKAEVNTDVEPAAEPAAAQEGGGPACQDPDALPDLGGQ